MLFVSVGREVEVGFIVAVGFTVSVTTTLGGRFVGWLDVGLTTLSRLWADAEPDNNPTENNAHTARQTILFEKFKPKTPIILLTDGEKRGSGE